MKKWKIIEKSELLIKVIIGKIKNKTKEQKGGLLPMLLGTLDVSLLGSALTRKGVIREDEGVIIADEKF